MPDSKPPIEQGEFHGVYTAGNPASRPPGTAASCVNLRIMPGGWLRLRGGRKGRYNLSSGEVYLIHPYRLPGQFGSDTQIVQIRYGAADVRWSWLSLLSYIPDPVNVLSINTTYDGAVAAARAMAVTNLFDSVLLYNGLGVRNVTNSRPPFSVLTTTGFRYFGLDAYCIGGNPTVSSALSGGGLNNVETKVKIWVGLYSSATGHYSNAVYCGEIGPTAGASVITVSNLSRLTYATHGSTETAQLYYVFYATLDGGNMPYLILDTALTGPYKVAVGSSSASLSIASGTDNGWVLNLAAEAPGSNNPPRPMRSVWYLTGRVYGIALSGGSGGAVGQIPPGGESYLPDFTYQWQQAQDYGGVWWSASASDIGENTRLGDPIQCWPLTNYSPTPGADQPIHGMPSLGDTASIIWSAEATYLLTEAADGIHEWTTISPMHGISRSETALKTPRGILWVTQRNDIAIFDGERVDILSRDFKGLLRGKTVRFADYLYDEDNQIDRYDVHCTDGTVVHYDFAIGGEAYSSTGLAFTAGRTVADSAGKQHHILAGTAFYTREGQPDNAGLIPTGDETFTTGQLKTTSYPTGEYVRNWDVMGERNTEKVVDTAFIQGDGEGLELEWYKDFAEITDANKQVCRMKPYPLGQSDWSRTDRIYELEFFRSKHHAIKFRLRMNAVSPPASHPPIDTQGDLVSNFWGSIVAFMINYRKEVSR